jgi:hypothetical protein
LAPYLTKENMPIIYLNHPIHGTKVATMEQEAEFDEQNGWVRYTHDTPLISQEVETVEKSAEIAAPVNTLDVKRRRKTAQ